MASVSSSTATSKIIRIRSSIILFGDSLTEFAFGLLNGQQQQQVGWASLLASAYTRRADVLNRGFSGYNTRFALDILPRVFNVTTTVTAEGGVRGGTTACANHSNSRSSGMEDEDSKTKKEKNLTTEGVLFCTIFFGANDASCPGEKLHVPLKEYGENIRKIIASIRERIETDSKNATIPLILMTPPPVDNEMWKQHCLSQNVDVNVRSNESAKQYGQHLTEIASSIEKCYVLDTFQLLGGDNNNYVNRSTYKLGSQFPDATSASAPNSGEVSSVAYQQYLSDGLHLNGRGNSLIFEGLMKLIRRHLSSVSPMVDGEGKYGLIGLPMEEKLWKEMVDNTK